MVRFGVVRVQITEVRDFAALGETWRDLERRSHGSFFQSWTWVGCLCRQRFPDPLLVQATDAGRTVALGLFNRIRRRLGPSCLYLGESGSPELDCPYIEQNGVLTEAGRESELTVQCLRPLAATHDLVLSGVCQPAMVAAQPAAAWVLTDRVQASPFVDLAAIRASGGDYLTGRSANTRQQLRRSDRFYQRQAPIVVRRADSVATAHAMLDRLAELHQRHWQARGKPGSFAMPFFGQFHHALIDVGFPRDEIALLQIMSGEAIIGILYNFIWKGRMSAYQSGFAYQDQENQAKPGLTCHHQAIRHALDQGLHIYDFLAGEDRYKCSLADRAHQQFWVRAGPIWSPRLMAEAIGRRVVC